MPDSNGDVKIFSQDCIQYTVITSASCELAKRFTRNTHGELESSAIAHMTEGHATIVAIGDVTQLGGTLPLLLSNQAITCGIPTTGATPLTTRAGAEFRPDAVARTNEAFRYPYGPAIFPIDVDVDSSEFRSVDAVLDALEACSPWLKWALRVAVPSSSSFVDERGLRGVHVYLAVTQGTDIPTLAKRMQIEQWAAGRGQIKVSKSGALLVRQLSDALVYQPSRLMFEAAPVLADGVTRTVPLDQAFVKRAPQVMGRPSNAAQNGMLDVQSLKPVRDIEVRRYDTAVRKAKNDRRREAKRVAIDYQRQQAVAQGLDPKDGERYGLLATRALGDKALPSSWELALKGGRVKVTAILADPAAYVGQHCADPFDTWRPDLAAKHFTKAEIVLMGDKPGVWSHKLQEFFQFTDDNAADLSSPLELAAEKLCGLIEYPEPVGKRAAPFVNVAHGLDALLREIDAAPRWNVCTSRTENEDDVPAVRALIDALSRIGCANVSPQTVESALAALADENRLDPWRDAMLALPRWDGEPRLDAVFEDVCGAAPSPALMLAGRLLFAAIVRRQSQPGAPCPVVPVLIGPQGCGKSQFVAGIARALGLPAPSSITFTDPREMSMRAARSIVAELSEMAGMGRRDAAEIKQWITDDVDAFRAPYGREAVDHPRRFVLIGTANEHTLNRDETGNRRFMPVHVAQAIDPLWTIEIPQLLSEAKTRFADDDAAYTRLVREAADAVREHNAADMARGIGTLQTDLDIYLPAIVRRLAAARPDRRVFAGQVADELHRQHAGARGASAVGVGKWLAARQWPAFKSNGIRGFVAPEGFMADDESIDPNATKPESFTQPTDRPALAVVH